MARLFMSKSVGRGRVPGSWRERAFRPTTRKWVRNPAPQDCESPVRTTRNRQSILAQTGQFPSRWLTSGSVDTVEGAGASRSNRAAAITWQALT